TLLLDEGLRVEGDGKARQLPQLPLDVVLAQPCFVERLRVVDAKEQQHAAAARRRRHIRGDVPQDLVGAYALAAGDVAEISGAENRHRALVARKALLDVVWRPGVVFLVLAAHVGIAERRRESRLGIDAGQRAADVDQREAYRAADRGIRPPARSEA